MRSASTFSLLALGLLDAMLAGCDPKPGPNSAPTAGPTAGAPALPAPPAANADSALLAASGCTAHVEGAWINQETPLRRYTAEATATGSTCEKAVAVLVIRAREGSPIYTWSGAARDIFGLKEASDAASMKAALADWIDQKNNMAPTSDKLPPWEKTDGQPSREEFPFHPAPDLDKAGWKALRQARLDVFCFPQGSESLACAALREGRMEDIGLQQSPG